MRPKRWLIIAGNAALVVLKVPFRLTAITCSQSSSVIFCRDLSLVIPALFTRTSMRCHFSRTVLTILFASSLIDTSP